MAHRNLDLGGADHGDRRASSRWCSPSCAPRPTRGDRPRSWCRSALGVVLIAVFLVLQARVLEGPARPAAHLPVPLGRGGNAVMFLMFGALFGSWYFETLYMQHVLGYSPLQAGLAFLPQTLLIAAGAQVTSRLVPRFGPRPLILLGTLVAGGGLAWLAQITTDSTFVADLLGPFVLIGLGMGLAVTPIAVAGTAGVRARRRAWPPGCSTRHAPWVPPSVWPRSRRSPPTARRVRWPGWRPRRPHRGGAHRRLCAGLRGGRRRAAW